MCLNLFCGYGETVSLLLPKQPLRVRVPLAALNEHLVYLGVFLFAILFYQTNMISIDQSLLIVILCGATLLYAVRWIAPEATSLLVIVGLVLAGLLKPNQALAGFASSATLTVAAMFILSAGLVRTGALEQITIQLARFSQGSRRRLLLMLGLFVPLASAFMNNTPVVVMLVPVVLSLSREIRTRPSKLLIPLSYFAILGGTITLIGTSTNILIDDLYRQMGGQGIGVFEFFPLGIAFTIVGVAYTVLISHRLFPTRSSLADLVGGRHQASYITEVVVDPQSSLVGKSADQAFAQIARNEIPPSIERRQRHRRIQRTPHQNQRNKRRQNQKKSRAILHKTSGNQKNAIELIQLIRDGYIYRAEEISSLRFMANDTLMIGGAPKHIALFLESNGVHLATVLKDNERVPIAEQDTTFSQPVVEAVVLPGSPYVGQLVGPMQFNEQHGVQILGIQRHGRQQLRGLRTMHLENGDVLLLRGSKAGLQTVGQVGGLLMVEGVEQSIVRSARNRQAIFIMLAVVALASITSVPIVVWALAGAALMVVTQCLRIEDAVRSLDANTLLLLAAAIPMGKAMETTGLADSAVSALLSVVGSANPIIFLSAFYLLANLLAQIISTKAVAVLFVPIALNLAVSLQMNPTPLMMAIAFGANASLTTPIGHPVNTIVMGPGGYRFGDYLRAGLPLVMLLWLTATICIPLLWPLR